MFLASEVALSLPPVSVPLWIGQHSDLLRRVPGWTLGSGTSRFGMRAIRLQNHLLRRKPASCIPSNPKWSKANPDFGNCKYCAVRADQIIVTDAKSPRAPLIAKMTLVLLPLAIPHAVRGQKAARDLSEASLEDLMNIEVTTVAKKEQKLSQSPAAAFVITQEDIRRSGMNTLPDLLRMVPGVQVGKIEGGQWAVGARGFSDKNSYSNNKLLVLVDGRSVYSPIDSGVFWDEQDTFLDNIERIEVIRGPGASLWGANAVNGVINIITKAAKDTQGALATTGGGDNGQSLAGFRYGGRLGESGYYRAFTKYSHGPSLWDSNGKPVIGGESSLIAGMRADWTLSKRDSLTVEVDAFRASAETGVTASQLPFAIRNTTSADTSGGSLMANWISRQSERSKTELSVYFSHPHRSELVYTDSYSTINADFQHAFTFSNSNDLTWGLGFRDSALSTAGTQYATFLPARRNDALYSGFVQDQQAIVRDRLWLILGSKFDHNNFTGAEIQPSAKLLFTPHSRQTLWAAVSRSVREPSMLENDLRSNPGSLAGPGGIPILLRTFGSESVLSEDVVSYELGYRFQTKRRFSLDLSIYDSDYTHLRTYEMGAPSFDPNPAPHLNVTTLFGNGMHGESRGVEIATNLNLAERWRLIPSYSWQELILKQDANSRDVVSAGIERQTPRHQFQIRSNVDLSRKLQFDAAAYYVGALPNLAIPAYTRLDARLGYRPRSDFEISLTGQNLQGGRHAEFFSVGPYPNARIGRSVFVTLTWGF